MREAPPTLRDWFISWRPIEVVEALLGVGAIAGLDLLIPAAWGINHLDLALLWVVVLAIAARYGAPSGYVAGISAALAYQFLFVRTIDTNQPLYPHILLQSLLIFAAGVMVSEIVRARKRAEQREAARLRRANAKLRDASHALEMTQAARTDLERRLAIQPVSTAMVITYARRMAAATPAMILPVLLETIIQVLGAEAAAIYVPTTDAPTQDRFSALVLAHAVPPQLPDRPMRLAPPVGISVRAIARRGVVTVLDVSPEIADESLALLAGPLFDEAGQLLGLVIIEQIAFAQFSPETVRLFGQILDWGAATLTHAQRVAVKHEVS